MNPKEQKINELRNKLKPYGARPPYDILKEVDRECMMNGIDNWLVRCTDQQFETVKTKGNLSEFKA